MAYLRLVALIAATAMLVACGTPDPAPETPAASTNEPLPISPPEASPSPYPTPVAAVTPIISTGWAIAIMDDGLFAVSIDRTDVPPSEPFGERIPLTDPQYGNSRISTYAGSIVEGGERWVYVVQLRPGDSEEPRVTLLRTSLNDGRQEKIMAFRASISSRDGILLETPAAVSPNGQHIAYADIEGLHLFDTGTGATQLLAQDSCPTGVAFEKCSAYSAPIWSPDSERLLVTKQLYEGTRLVYVDVANGPTVTEYDGLPGDRKAWSPDGMHFCALNETFAPGGVWVGNSDTSQAIDLAASIPGTPQTCAWSAPDRLAIAYTKEVISRPDLGLTIPQTFISIRDASSADTSMLDLQVPLPRSRLAGWIPFGEGLLVHTTPACEPEPCPNTIMSGVMGLDGAYQGFTFNPGAVLALIPKP